MTGTPYTNYVYKFPKTGLATALEALQALRSAGIIDGGNLPMNMLGDLRDAAGAVVGEDAAAWKGGEGRAVPTLDSDGNPTGGTVNVGDPAYFYVSIRSETPRAEIPFDPSVFGLEACAPGEAEAVLGVWA